MVDSYIIRIYRYKRGNPRRLIGTVEKVGFKRKAAFTNPDDLWEIINPQDKRRRERKGEE